MRIMGAARLNRKAIQPKSVNRRQKIALAAVITEKIVNHVKEENVVGADVTIAQPGTVPQMTGRPVIALAVTDLLMKAGVSAMIAATVGAVHRSRRSQIY